MLYYTKLRKSISNNLNYVWTMVGFYTWMIYNLRPTNYFILLSYLASKILFIRSADADSEISPFHSTAIVYFSLSQVNVFQSCLRCDFISISIPQNSNCRLKTAWNIDFS